jgi:NAD(P)-dependent dehydrogenase (short-subunit alcohol dehydrogenase family)
MGQIENVRITTPFGFHTTAFEVVKGVDLSGKRALVTGASSGIGVETARALAKAGADVTLAVRDIEAGKHSAGEIQSGNANARLHVQRLDLTDGASIAALAESWEGPLHILVNNAGVMACPEQRTPEGLEWQFATNHLGHFALALGLHSALVEAKGARIISVSSSGHQISPVVFDDIQFAHRPYDTWQAYGQSKTANALFAVEATRRWSGEGIYSNALMPGAIPTNLQRHVGGVLRTPREYSKTTQEGAATSVLLAASPLLQGVGGRYFADCNEARPLLQRSTEAYLDLDAVASYAIDPEAASHLWDVSLRLLSKGTSRG